MWRLVQKSLIANDVHFQMVIVELSDHCRCHPEMIAIHSYHYPHVYPVWDHVTEQVIYVESGIFIVLDTWGGGQVAQAIHLQYKVTFDLICRLTILQNNEITTQIDQQKKLYVKYIFMHFNYTDVDPLIQDFYTDVDPGFSKWKHGRYSRLPTSFFQSCERITNYSHFSLSLQN